MATIIDALVVTLGLDGTKFKQGQKEAETALKRTRTEADTAAKEIEASGKRAVEFYHGLRRAALEFFSVLAAGKSMRDLVAGSTDATAQLGRLATNIGMATNQLAAWQGAAERFGGSASATAGSFQSLSQQFQQFQLTGQSAVIPFFRALGVGVADAEGKLRPLGDIMLDLSDKFRTMAPQRALAMGSALGLDAGTVNLLRQGRAGVEGLFAQQRGLGVTTDAEAANAARRRNAWLDFTQALETAARRIMDALTPAVTALLEQFTGLAQWMGGPEFRPVLDRVSKAMKDFGEYIGSESFRSDVSSLVTGIKGLAAAVVEGLMILGVIDRPAAPAPPPLGSPGAPPNNWWNRNMPGWMGTMRPRAQPASYTPGGDALDPAMVRDRLAASLGLSTNQAAGIVSGLHAESGLRPGITRPGGQDFGLAQWVGPRRRALEAFAAERGTTRDDAGTQMDFIAHELRTQYPQVLARIRAARSATEAGRAFHDYEAGGAAQFEHLRDWHAARSEQFASAPGGDANRWAYSGGRGSTTNSHAVTITGPITIQTQATDAPGIAASLGDAIRRYAFVPQANTGLT